MTPPSATMESGLAQAGSPHAHSDASSSGATGSSDTAPETLGKIYHNAAGRPQRVLFIQECISAGAARDQWISRAAKNAGHQTKFVW